MNKLDTACGRMVGTGRNIGAAEHAIPRCPWLSPVYVLKLLREYKDCKLICI
jgi:hypothetical protein